MPQLPRADAARRNARPVVSAQAPSAPPKLRHRQKHHIDTRRFWDTVCDSPQAGLFSEATWEWLQAKMWRFDAYYADPQGASTALARELDDVAAKLILLPRDAVARGFTPAAQEITKPVVSRGAGRGRRSRKTRLSLVEDPDAS